MQIFEYAGLRRLTVRPRLTIVEVDLPHRSHLFEHVHFHPRGHMGPHHGDFIINGSNATGSLRLDNLEIEVQMSGFGTIAAYLPLNVETRPVCEPTWHNDRLVNSISLPQKLDRETWDGGSMFEDSKTG
ncbi:hypothetical protein BDZ45DRAFT_6536 [Acephala macrosclerotiorum]|nr:hypothetical protein BDZ45DRAFT_6536 [Acephala macrosclerotiorum]